MTEIALCKKCLKRCELKPKKFRKSLAKSFVPKEGDEVEFTLTSCMKLCPYDTLAFEIRVYDGKELVRATRVRAQAPEVEAVVRDIHELTS